MRTFIYRKRILWIKLDKTVFGVDFIIGAMYYPYEGTKLSIY